MKLNFSQQDIVRFKNQAEGIQRRAKAALARADEAVSTVITTTEVGAASFLFGLAQGKFGGISIVGVPVDLLSGLALHIAAFAGLGGANAHHLHAFGDGALASYLNGLGRQVGRSIQTPEDRARIARSGVAGDSGSDRTGGASLADEELARMVRGGR
jgi:hypothetical protein